MVKDLLTKEIKCQFQSEIFSVNSNIDANGSEQQKEVDQAQQPVKYINIRLEAIK